MEMDELCIGILGSLVIFIVGLILFLVGWSRIKRNKKLHDDGLKAEAVITSISRNYLDQGSQRSSYSVSVAFKDLDGREIEGDLPFSPGSDFVEHYPEGSAISIIYLPEKPTVFTTVGGDLTDAVSSLFTVVGVLIMFLSFFVLYKSLTAF